jgi:hypothetical protein
MLQKISNNLPKSEHKSDKFQLKNLSLAISPVKKLTSSIKKEHQIYKVSDKNNSKDRM